MGRLEKRARGAKRGKRKGITWERAREIVRPKLPELSMYLTGDYAIMHFHVIGAKTVST